jgi:mannose-6-phosphate isomerase-like protein (cupin superfamily)/DNA-binding XRE family transcriptional regulator
MTEKTVIEALGTAATADRPEPYATLGARLRDRRQRTDLSLREIARRIGVSASLISQIETGKVQPSVATLYALVRELGGSFDEIMFGELPAVGDGGADGLPHHDDGPQASHNGGQGAAPGDAPGDAAGSALRNHPPVPMVQRADNRKMLQFNSGVRWERLTAESVPGLEFLFVVYEPGAESGPPGDFQRHSGREWCYIISGTLDIVVGFESHQLGPGDAITYDSTVPHRLENRGSTPVESVWFQLG